jgi:hypothetical protein
MISYHGRYRDHDYRLAYVPDVWTADIDIFAPDGRHFAFELSVIDHGERPAVRAKRQPLRLAATVRAYIDGAINHADNTNN